jgi:ketosteroid isomerase-like protein
MLLVLLLAGCAATTASTTSPENDVNATLDAFHAAASKADEAKYFDLYASSGIFFGTDATERWSKEEFRAYAHPHFSKGKGWTFTPRDRHVYFSKKGDVAWFDERLDSASYGECRGTGVLQWREGGWKIEQYNLTIPIPNDLADEFVRKIRGK